MSRDPDFDLVRRCQSETGDAEAAFEELFQAYRDRVFSLAARMVGNFADAEDVTQEAFVTVYRKIHDFRLSSRFYTWLYRIVYNLCVDKKRRVGILGTVRGRTEDREDLLAGIPDPRSGPLETVTQVEYRNRSVERALQRLSQPLRAVVLLRYLEELSYAEIAEVLDCSVGTVKSRLSRAHRFLQETLNPTGIPPLEERGKEEE